MKLFAIIFAAFFIAVSLGIFIFAGAASLVISASRAEEYSPLDFISGCDRFEVVVGADRENGRYATYRYEFAD